MSVDPKNVAVHQGDADAVLSQKPVLVHWLVVSNTSSSSRYLKVYDGESASGVLKLWIEASGKACSDVHISVPMYLSSGLFIDVEAANIKFSIGYEIIT